MAMTGASPDAQSPRPARPRAPAELAPLVEELVGVPRRTVVVTVVVMVAVAVVGFALRAPVVGVAAVESVVLVAELVFVLVVVHVLTSVRLVSN
jgi:hypothetical protein